MVHAGFKQSTTKMNEKVTTLLNKFKDVTGIPAILNTSFNDNGEPIVESPQKMQFVHSKIWTLTIL